MAEESLVAYLQKGMKGEWSCTKHNDMSTAGISDLSYRVVTVNGWIECKTIEKLPAKEQGIVRFKHPLSLAQALFIKERNGKLLVRKDQSPRMYLGFNAEETWEMYSEGGWAWPRMCLFSAKLWNRRIDWKEMTAWLSQ